MGVECSFSDFIPFVFGGKLAAEKMAEELSSIGVTLIPNGLLVDGVPMTQDTPDDQVPVEKVAQMESINEKWGPLIARQMGYLMCFGKHRCIFVACWYWSLLSAIALILLGIIKP